MVIETDLMQVEIRRELPGDVSQIRRTNELAFAGTAEADVIDRLRQTCPEFISFVAIAAEAGSRAYPVYTGLVGNAG